MGDCQLVQFFLESELFCDHDCNFKVEFFHFVCFGIVFDIKLINLLFICLTVNEHPCNLTSFLLKYSLVFCQLIVVLLQLIVFVLQALIPLLNGLQSLLCQPKLRRILFIKRGNVSDVMGYCCHEMISLGAHVLLVENCLLEHVDQALVVCGHRQEGRVHIDTVQEVVNLTVIKRHSK